VSGIFIFLIISRSSLDVFTNTRILFSILNVPSLVGFLIILAAGAALSLDIGKGR
jgi:hypothetical protein